MRDEDKNSEPRDDVQRALAGLGAAERHGVFEEILDGLAATLPIPALVLDACGNLAWSNAEARARLGLVAAGDGDDGGPDARASGCFEELVRWIRQASGLRDAGDIGAGGERPPWLAAGEQIVVRRLGDATPCGELVCMYVPPDVSAPPTEPSRELGLSGREREVALLAAQGYTALNIAARLDIAESTVKTYFKRIYGKLGVFSRVELTRAVLRKRR